MGIGHAPVRIDRTMTRGATIALVLHATLLFILGAALATFLTPPTPYWLMEPQNQEFATLVFRYGGQTAVALGAVAGLLHAMSHLGWRRAMGIFVIGFCIALAAEFVGATTDAPFGANPYSTQPGDPFTTELGYLMGGRVPFNIPASWFFMLYASLAICGRLLAARDDAMSRWRWAAVAALVLTAWNVALDPAMIATSHWLPYLPWAEDASLGRGLLYAGFYGAPLSNLIGWLLTGTLVARVMLAIVPPSAWAARVSPSNLPLFLYGVNALLPLLICVGRGMWGAVLFGAIAMAIPLVLAVVMPRRGFNSRRALTAIVGMARG